MAFKHWLARGFTPATIAVIVLCLTVSWAVWDLDRAAHSEISWQNSQEQSLASGLQSQAATTSGHVDKVLDAATGTINAANGIISSANKAGAAQADSLRKVTDQAAAVLAHVNRNCGVKADGQFLPCGTLADVAQTLGAYRRTATLVNIAARHEDRQLGQVDDSISRFNDLLAAVKVSVSGLQPLEKQLTVLITATQPGVASADHMLATADEVETKGTKDYLHPSKNPIKRTFKAIRPFLIPGAEVAGSIAR